MTERDDPLASAPPLWNQGHDDTLICRQIRRETHDVTTFLFAAPEPRLFRFRPGQFLTFEFEIDGASLSRCYTIASPPTRPDGVAITVKHHPGGIVSGWLHAALRPGMALLVAGPMGDFTPDLSRPTKYLFLSAGSGITPLMAMARTLYDLGGLGGLGEDTDMVFVHGARTPADIIFRDELALLGAHPGMRVAVHCVSETPLHPWQGLRGRLSPAMLDVIAPDLLEREVFTCGPAGYMRHVRALLEQTGFDMARYHEESFDLDRLTPAEPDAAPAALSGGFRIDLTRSARVIECDGETMILDAARRAGLRLPSSCTRGVCGTCKCRLIAGRVDMQHGGGIRQREIDAGMILICCARPMTDLVIER